MVELKIRQDQIRLQGMETQADIEYKRAEAQRARAQAGLADRSPGVSASGKAVLTPVQHGEMMRKFREQREKEANRLLMNGQLKPEDFAAWVNTNTQADMAPYEVGSAKLTSQGEAQQVDIKAPGKSLAPGEVGAPPTSATPPVASGQGNPFKSEDPVDFTALGIDETRWKSLRIGAPIQDKNNPHLGVWMKVSANKARRMQ